MAKTFEALERAQKESQLLKNRTAMETKEKYLLAPLAKPKALISSNGWQDLQTRLLSRYPNQSPRTLMFTGINHGIGVTSSIVKFSQALAKSSGSKILIIDTNLRTPSLHTLFNLNPANGLEELLVDNGVKMFKFKKVGDEGLFVAFACGQNYSEGIGYFESKTFDALIESAHQKFDYTILDSAPIGIYSESQAICSKVDGVLLVIEAGKTRREVAIRAKIELEEAGGKLLGVILNKRKYYIPNWIYKRL